MKFKSEIPSNEGESKAVEVLEKYKRSLEADIIEDTIFLSLLHDRAKENGLNSDDETLNHDPKEIVEYLRVGDVDSNETLNRIAIERVDLILKLLHTPPEPKGLNGNEQVLQIIRTAEYDTQKLVASEVDSKLEIEEMLSGAEGAEGDSVRADASLVDILKGYSEARDEERNNAFDAFQANGSPEDVSREDSKSFIRDFRKYFLSTAEFIGDKKTLEYFEENFVCQLEKHMENLGMEIPSEFQSFVSGEVRSYLDNLEAEREKKRLSGKELADSIRQRIYNEDASEFIKQVRRDHGTMLDSAPDEWKVGIVEEAVNKNLEELEEGLKTISGETGYDPDKDPIRQKQKEDERKEVNAFLEAFPDPRKFVDIILGRI